MHVTETDHVPHLNHTKLTVPICNKYHSILFIEGLYTYANSIHGVSTKAQACGPVKTFSLNTYNSCCSLLVSYRACVKIEISTQHLYLR